MLFLLPDYVPCVQDGSALASGLEIAPFGLGLGLFAALSGRLGAGYGLVALVGGLLVAAAGYAALLLLSNDSSPALVLLGTGLVGCGFGLTFPPATAMIMNDLGTEKAGDGAAVNQVARQVGGALGVAIVGSVFATVTRRGQRRQRRARRGDGVDRGGSGRGEPPPGRGPCRPPERRHRGLRRGCPLGPCHLPRGHPPRGSGRGLGAVEGIPGRALSGSARARSGDHLELSLPGGDVPRYVRPWRPRAARRHPGR